MPAQRTPCSSNAISPTAVAAMKDGNREAGCGAMRISADVAPVKAMAPLGKS
jgi:hypothetical protein